MYRQSYTRRNSNWGGIAAVVLGVLAHLVVVTVVVAFLVTIVWHWVVPDVFEGAVEQGILPASLSVIQAFKLSVLFTILGLTSRVSASRSD